MLHLLPVLNCFIPSLHFDLNAIKTKQKTILVLCIIQCIYIVPFDSAFYSLGKIRLEDHAVIETFERLKKIDKINNIARYNLIETKYHQMALQLARSSVVAQYLGTPGQTKVIGDCQRETTHEISCLPAKFQQNLLHTFSS